MKLFTFRIKRSHVTRLLHIVRSHLNLVLKNGRWIPFIEHFIDAHVKSRDDLLRIADELPVQRFIEGFQMLAVDVEERLFQSVNLGILNNKKYNFHKAKTHLFKFLQVKWLVQIHALSKFILFD